MTIDQHPRLTKSERAHRFAAAVPRYSPKVWIKGTRIRVYLVHPRTEESPGGGDLGYVDFSGAEPVLRTRLTPEQASEIRAALQGVA